MILYHFTSLFNLKNVGPENILAVGLKAQPARQPVVGPIPDCVWLTSNPDMPKDYSSFAEVRIELVIPSSDKRLVPYPKYFRKHTGHAIDIVKIPQTEEAKRFYLYFGDIPLSALRVVNYGPGFEPNAA